MLHYLPMPRPDELLYSVFARYAVHMGIVSPKQCLDDLFGCRTVVATADLPSHLDAFLTNADHFWDISPENLIYRHTLFPLYALFVPNERRQSALSQMRSGAGGALHVQLGVAASTVSPPRHLRFCPTCLQEQRWQYGEYFWRRSWQVTGINSCNRHGRLSDSSVHFRHMGRHRFVAAVPSNCITHSAIDPRSDASAIDRAFGDLVVQLLEMPPLPSPNYYQWSQFYHELAVYLGYSRGAHVHHQALQGEFQHIWSGGNDSATKRASSWLTGLFRKHRKSFSYLQHLAVWAAFLPGHSVEDTVRHVSSLTRRQSVPAGQVHSPSDTSDLPKYRCHWRHALECYGRHGTKWIRVNVSGMAAVYAWLYRHDRPWLLKKNEEYRAARPVAPERADWPARDQALSRKLRQIANICDSISTRRTKTWYINQLPRHASVAKNLRYLPLCATLLQELSESVADYQIRRCKYAMKDLMSEGLPLARWRIERKAGIGVRSIRPATDRFLTSLKGAACGKSDNSKYPQ